ncbi:MAG: glycosyltransferase [Eubacteriales bacterium]|jgi:glycosyltransferase involved in cell wall biosynthesis
MKVSVIVTLKNEVNNIKILLDSLLVQSREPDEIVFCDNNSSDGTAEVIKEYILKNAPIKLIVKEANIAKGRNIAIDNAIFDIIAVTDAGCRADRNWLRNLVQPFEEDEGTMVVGGFFKADCTSLFEKCYVSITLRDHDNINLLNWSPSSRSIAFKKEAWHKVGGYPEHLTGAGEDTLFNISLRKAGYKFKFALKALVHWKPRSNIKSFFTQYFNYSRGDGQALIYWNLYLRKILAYTLGMFLLIEGSKYSLLWIVLVLAAFSYLVFKSFKPWRKIRGWKSAILIPVLIIILDLAYNLGFTQGVLDNFIKEKKIDC